MLVRKRNGGALDAATFSVARSALRAEVIDDPDFGVLAVEFSDILGGIDLIDRHKLNSADASILVSFINFAQAQPGPDRLHLGGRQSAVASCRSSRRADDVQPGTG